MHPRESALRFAPFVLTVFFGIVFAAIADLAWLTAVKTTAPWFTSTISSQMYASTLTAGSLGALLLISIATGRLARLKPFRWLPGSRGGFRRERTGTLVNGEAGASLAGGPPPAPEGIEQIIADLEKLTEVPLHDGRETGRGGTVQVSVPRSVARSRGSPLESALTAGDPERSQAQRAFVWQTVAGPLAMLIVFVTIGGAMLPGSGAFAMAHFQLNTGLILFLGYGWAFLVAWTVVAILLLNAPAGDRTIPRIENIVPTRR